jgi:hypothetical protein
MCSSETSISTYITTRCHDSKDHDLNLERVETTDSYASENREENFSSRNFILRGRECMGMTVNEATY